MEISAASAQGSREEQEDRWVSLPLAGGHLLAVFDGHRGADTAEFAALALPELVQKYWRDSPSELALAMSNVFGMLHAETQTQIAGSTASLAFISSDGKTVTLGVLGDSPIAVLDSAGLLHTGPDHNIRTNLQERGAAESRGGVIHGGYLEDSLHPGVGLQMGRALGDVELSRVLNREPDIQTIALGGQGIVLVGSDGLFSPWGGQGLDQLKPIMEKIRLGAGAHDIVQDALDRQTGDNVTVLVWKSL